jgi:hypothetical protein
MTGLRSRPGQAGLSIKARSGPSYFDPTAGSELAQKAVIHGLALAKSVGAKITALTAEASFNIYECLHQ